MSSLNFKIVFTIILMRCAWEK